MASKGTTRLSRTHTAAHSWGEIPRPGEAGGSSEAKGKKYRSRRPRRPDQALCVLAVCAATASSTRVE
jgi:hypothetical protein